MKKRRGFVVRSRVGLLRFLLSRERRLKKEKRLKKKKTRIKNVLFVLPNFETMMNVNPVERRRRRRRKRRRAKEEEERGGRIFRVQERPVDEREGESERRRRGDREELFF